jgi:glycosidase
VGVAVRANAGLAALACALALPACGSSESSGPGITPNTQGWWRDDVFYEVFVRSFADSNGDGVGDLDGITRHLDDLNDGRADTDADLGVDAIWLMPIHPASSYHGYDVTDYRAVNPEYGTLQDLDELVAAAHARGVKVVLDMVLNHSSSQHPWFRDSVTGPAAAKRGWYVWSDTNPGWQSPNGSGSAWTGANGAYYYSAFNGGMPDLNLRNALVEQELVDAMRFWLARGVDGFRLDAVRYFYENGPGDGLRDQPENHAFLKRIRAALQADYPDALLVAEAWAMPEVSATYYGNGDEVQLAFSFYLADAILTATQSGQASGLNGVLRRFEESLAGKDRGYEAPFLSNHDTGRGARGLRFTPGGARVSAATLLAMPGTPFLYYGEEIGMQGGDSDPQKRTPFRWNATAPGYGFTTAAATWCDLSASCQGTTETAGTDLASQRGDPGSLWHLHRALVALRHAQPALARGEASRPAITGGSAGTFALLRTHQAQRVLFVAQYGAAAGAFDVAVSGAPTVLLHEGLAGTPSAGTGKITVPGLGASSFAFIALN